MRKTSLLITLLIGHCLVGCTGLAVAGARFTAIAEFEAPQARQGVGVDEHHFYAVNNRSITKHDKQTGQLVDRWDDADGGAMIHLDSAVVIDGRLYASHSNWRELPMTSSVEIWDADSLEHIGTHSFGRKLGSLTWLDFHDGYWWGTFANYDRLGPDGKPYGHTANTTLAKFDEHFNVRQTWIFPAALLAKFGEMSNSGGSWGADGFLYLTGHDLPEVYKVRIPRIGSVLKVVDTLAINIRGQGIAWDRNRGDVLYGIVRATKEERATGVANKVVSFRLESTAD